MDEDYMPFDREPTKEQLEGLKIVYARFLRKCRELAEESRRREAEEQQKATESEDNDK